MIQKTTDKPWLRLPVETWPFENRRDGEMIDYLRDTTPFARIVGADEDSLLMMMDWNQTGRKL